MKKILLTIIFLTLFTIFPQQVSASTSKVAVIGSSTFSAGCKGSGFVIKLRKAYPEKIFECFAENSKDTKYFKDQFNSKVKGNNFNELIIYAGLNGLSNLTESQKHLKEIFQAAEAEKITVIVISAQPFKDNTYNSWSQPWGDNLIKNHQWLATKPEGIDYFVDIYSIVKDNSDQYKLSPTYASKDFLHMNQKGQDLIFEKISEIYNTGSITNPGSTPGTTSPLTLTTSEIEKLVTQPTLQIRIPGLNFTNGIELLREKDGKIYVYNTFFQQYIVAVYRYSVVAISIIAVVMIMVAGLQWLTSGGSPDKIKLAQKRIGQSVIGLLIIVGSYTILYTINPYLVGFSAFRSLYIGEEIYEKGELTESSLKLGKSVDNTDFDSIFKLYQPCLEVDWKILKAIAYTESRFNANAKSPTGYGGLFQTKIDFCKKGYLNPYNLQSKCDNINDPEVSTMVGVSSLIKSKKIVEEICPNASFESKIFFMYTCHHSGNTGCRNVMKLLKAKSPTCDHTLAKEIIYENWLMLKRRTVEEDDLIYAKYLETKDMSKYYSAKMHANHGTGGGLRTLSAAIHYGATMSYISNNMSNCPLTNKSLIGTATK